MEVDTGPATMTPASPTPGAVGDVVGASPRAAAALRSPGAARRVLEVRVSEARAVRCQSVARGCALRKRLLVATGLSPRGRTRATSVGALIPTALSRRLLSHQRTGVRWLFRRWAYAQGILADEATIQGWVSRCRWACRAARPLASPITRLVRGGLCTFPPSGMSLKGSRDTRRGVYSTGP